MRSALPNYVVFGTDHHWIPAMRDATCDCTVVECESEQLRKKGQKGFIKHLHKQHLHGLHSNSDSESAIAVHDTCGGVRFPVLSSQYFRDIWEITSSAAGDRGMVLRHWTSEGQVAF